MKPLKFEPLLKSTIWGGNKIINFKHLNLQQEKVGESWEISGVPGNESIVADGEMKGKSLNEVVAQLKDSFLGKENYQRFGNEFPLLIKFIDANTDLSIQVHPNDEIAHKQGKERGKTEMWYALPCDPEAKLYNGLKMKITPEDGFDNAGQRTVNERARAAESLLMERKRDCGSFREILNADADGKRACRCKQSCVAGMLCRTSK